VLIDDMRAYLLPQRELRLELPRWEVLIDDMRALRVSQNVVVDASNGIGQSHHHHKVCSRTNEYLFIIVDVR
jgi:hypothetical protein